VRGEKEVGPSVAEVACPFLRSRREGVVGIDRSKMGCVHFSVMQSSVAVSEETLVLTVFKIATSAFKLLSFFVHKSGRQEHERSECTLTNKTSV
jgi:hypothetical protein